MLSQLQSSYQRLEQSLQRLTDSIVTYNPSVAAAEELVAADNAISHDLERLTRHQANHARILQLRQTVDSLDSTLKSTVRLLAETRREILAIPSHDQTIGKELHVDELLNYAKFISKTSQHVTPIKEKQNGTVKTENVGLQSMDEQLKRNLDPMRDVPFEPWPPYAVIQQGSLADIQRMVDAGKDPASILSAEEQAEADRLKKEEEEREKQEQEEREKRRASLIAGHSSRGAAQDDVFDPDEM